MSAPDRERSGLVHFPIVANNEAGHKLLCSALNLQDAPTPRWRETVMTTGTRIGDTMRKLSLVMVLIFVNASSMAWGQGAAINADVVRSAILAAPLWHVDRSNGTSLWRFEMRGEKLWVKSDISDANNAREVPVEVTTDGLTWIGRGGQQITLHYDPRDIQFPFKGADSEGRTYEFTPK